MGKVTFTKKQNDLMRLFKQNKLPRLTVLQGSVRSGKTWISLILWALWVASRPRDYLYMMTAKSLQTLKRNCLLTLFPEDFFVMLLSRLSAPGAKLFATTNPDTPTHWLKKKYLDNEALADDLLNIFFSIDDNTTLPADYVSALKKEYTGVFYDRFILGKWVVAAGAIYRVFSDNIPAFAASEPLPRLDMINVGMDWGGNGSAHAMVATGVTHDYGKLIALRSERVSATGLTPQQIYKRIYEFCEGIQRDFGKVEDIYADSAEQTLISGLREYIKPLDLTVKNSMKRPIIDRIRATTMLMGGERFLLTSECETLRDAFQGAVYDDKVVGEDVRLDNGTSDIDTLDAFEYSFERYIPRLIRRDQ